MTRRGRARAWILQVLYAWDVRGGDVDLPELGRRMLAEGGLASGVPAPPPGPESREFVLHRLEAVASRRVEIDALLGETTRNWEFHRLSAIDRNILRLATCELLAFPDVPWRVVIDEAVELARRYGGDDSPRFVNGVLDAVRLRLERASAGP